MWPRLLLVALLAIPPGLHAQEVEIEKGLAPEAGKGIAVLSLSLSGYRPGGFKIAYRSVTPATGIDEDLRLRWAVAKLFGAWQSDFDDRDGKLLALQLPEGLYEFYDYTGQSGDTTYRSGNRFSQQFRVRAGQVLYVGALNVRMDLGAEAFRPFNRTATTYIEWSDRFDQDMTVLKRRWAAAEPAAIPKNIALGRAEQLRDMALAETLRAAEAGDTSAQLDLVAEYLNLQFSTFAHRAVVMPPRDELAARRWLERALAAKDPWAVYADGMLGSSRMRYAKLSEKLFPLDDRRAVARIEEAARSGLMMAMVTLARAYEKGDFGLERDAEKSRHWRAEYERNKGNADANADAARRLRRPAAGQAAMGKPAAPAATGDALDKGQ